MVKPLTATAIEMKRGKAKMILNSFFVDAETNHRLQRLKNYGGQHKTGYKCIPD